MNLTMQGANKFGSLTTHELDQFAQQLPSSLPLDYREFLLQYNGGQPEPATFLIDAEQGTTDLQWLYGLHDGPDWANLWRARDVYHNRVPSELLPIGHDSGGNLVCISLGTEDRGAVYFWDHEREVPEGQPPIRTNLHRVARSFTDFLQRLAPAIPNTANVVEQACQEGNIDLVRQYLHAGGEANYSDQDGYSLAQTAAVHGHLAILQLLQETGADIQGLVTIAAQNGYAALLEYLLAQGGEVDERRDNRGDTPLIKATTFGHRAVVEVLLRHGANIRATNKYGQTALAQAVQGNHDEIIGLLQQAGAQ